MGARPETGLRLRQRLRRWFADLEFHQMWQLAVVAILAVTALFGGLDSVNTKGTEFKPGQEFSDGQFTITVDHSTLANEISGGGLLTMPAKPGRRYLGVVADVRNDATVPGRLADELDLRDQPDKEFVGVLRIADGSRLVTLGPGLSDRLGFVWELPEDAVRPGQSVTVRVWKKQFVELSVTYGKAWLDSLTDYGQVVVPVRSQT